MVTKPRAPIVSLLANAGYPFLVFLSLFALSSVSTNFVYYFSSADGRADMVADMKANNPSMLHLNNTEGLITQEVYLKAPITVQGFHLAPVLIWSIAFPLQLSARIRRLSLKLHRWIGRLALLCSLSLSISGILICFWNVAYSVEADSEITTFFTFDKGSYALSVWFLFTNWKAFTSARARKITEHKRWVLRHAAGGYSVMVMRIFMVIYTGVAEAIDWEFKTDVNMKQLFFGWSLWAGSIVNISTMEFYLLRTNTNETFEKRPK
ncbi:hypothetical protein K7432_007753 [Basidiobolus ranarum]|uniref:Uncharacterized protein n=1 Tax=Basidiobolus ranarum TaxID=34480 RepID=A0ABR2WSU9_9FUNG